jgi:urease accessory protein
MTIQATYPNASRGISNLLYILQVATTTYPTGAFNHSLGFETLIEEGTLTTQANLFDITQDWLLHSLAPTDGCAVRLAHQYAWERRFDSLATLDHLVNTIKLPREIRDASARTGAAFMAVTRESIGGEALEEFANQVARGQCKGHQAVAFGGAAADAKLLECDAVVAFLHSCVSNVVNVAARLIPLGQNSVQQVLTGCWPYFKEGLAVARMRDEATMGAACTAADIAAMRHETQRVRLCMS